MKPDKYFRIAGLEFPIYGQRLIRFSIATWIILSTVLFVAQYFFQYEMTGSDVPGGLISGFLFAYLLTLLLD
ncbi:MAG: hypothetical protein AAFQ02_04745 [Bacteroidota bacterium]